VRVDPQTLDFVGPERPAATHGLSACDAAHLKLALRRSLVLVIQDPQDSSNKLNSAAWAALSLTRAGANSNTAQRGHDLVMATQQGVPTALGSSPGARLLVDIDLSTLGSQAGGNLTAAPTCTQRRLAQ